MIKITKFGGSSVANAQQFRKVKHIIERDPARRFVVVSASGREHKKDNKVTDLLYLIEAHLKYSVDHLSLFHLIEERFISIKNDLGLSYPIEEDLAQLKGQLNKTMSTDYLVSRGEYLTAKLMAEYLGFPFVDAKDIITFRYDGKIDFDATKYRMDNTMKKLDRFVIPGFYGALPDGTVRTMSRGGSDITGSILADILNADMYENWTDVSGFLITDPRIIPNPKAIDVITYRELRELSYMGATVLHEDAIFPVRKEGIPINIRNTNIPEDKGTLIVESTCRKPRFVITGIAGKKDFASITVEKAMMNTEVGFCKKVLEVFSDNGISIEHMPSGIDTFTIFVHQDEFEEKEQKVIAGIHRAVEPDFLELESDLALIAVVGRGMRATRGTSGRIFSALAHANVNVKMIDQGSSELNIIIGVRNHDFETAIRAIYDIFVNTML